MSDPDSIQADQAPTLEDQLVAYLDGELSESQSAAMEQQLRDNSQLRQRAEELDRTWGMLDNLEQVTAQEQFSQATMETVVATAVDSRPAATSRTRTLLQQALRSQVLAWMVLGAVGTLLGLSLSGLRSAPPQVVQTEQMLRQLDVLLQYPRYSVAPSLQSLQQLELPQDAASSNSGDKP